MEEDAKCCGGCQEVTCNCQDLIEQPEPEYVLKWKSLATIAVVAGACGMQYIAGEGGIVLTIIGLWFVW